MAYENVEELRRKIATSISIDDDFPILPSPKLGLTEPFHTSQSIQTEILTYADLSQPEEKHLRYGNGCGIGGKQIAGNRLQPWLDNNTVYREMPDGPFNMHITLKSDLSPLVLKLSDKDGQIFEEVDLMPLKKHIDEYVASMRDVFQAASMGNNAQYIELKDEQRRDSHAGLSQQIYEEAYRNNDLVMREYPTDYLARVIGLLFPQGFSKGMRIIEGGNTAGFPTYGFLISNSL